MTTKLHLLLASRPRRRWLFPLLAALSGLALLMLSGCGGNASVSLGDLPDITADTLSDLLIGPPPDPTAMAPADAPLLKKGKKESVVVAADTASFASISRGNVPENALRDALRDTVKILNRRLSRRGFTATASPNYPPDTPADVSKTLVATLAPATEETGSPEEKARGKQRTLVLVRLTITDPETGTVLRQRDYYSGKDVKNPNLPSPQPSGY